MGADWLTEPSDEQSREAREIYALAGLALYCAQCLEHEIVNTLGIVAILKTPKESADLRRTSDYESYVDGVWNEAFRKTLGGLISSLRKSGVQETRDLEDDLNRSLDARNCLVHSYFRDRAASFLTPAGRQMMAQELTKMRDQFAKTDRALHELTGGHREALGITDRILAGYVELMKRGVCEDQDRKMVAEEKGGGRAKSRSL
jgi:hypothetical protein